MIINEPNMPSGLNPVILLSAENVTLPGWLATLGQRMRSTLIEYGVFPVEADKAYRTVVSNWQAGIKTDLIIPLPK